MFKYCPECKSSAISFVNNHYISCTHCNFLYYHNTAGSVAAIIEFENDILLTIRAKNPGLGLLDLPGGFVDHNESLEQALIREVYEELSFNIQPEAIAYLTSEPNIYEYKNITYNTIDSIFVIKLTEKPNIALEKSEITEVLWLKKDKINIEQLAFSSIKKVLKDYITVT